MDEDSQEIVQLYKERIQAINKLRKFGTPRREIRKLKIAAIQEAGRDILNTSIINGRFTTGEIGKNNYRTYQSQVDGAYKMYEGQTDFGSEIVGSVLDMRVAFIAGEGISFVTKNKAKEEFINAFLKSNDLNGSMLLDAVLMGEMEGKVLFTLAADKENKTVQARLFSWYNNKYTVNRDPNDYKKITSITYKKSNNDANETEIKLDSSVYLRLGGCNYRNEDTPTRIGRVLTQCENASRASYDLRKNTHIFGKIMPYWKTADGQSAKVINQAIQNKSFEIGDGYAGPAEMKLLEPQGTAADAIEKDYLMNIRTVAHTLGIPIHWLSWPELMSNRATAENFLEVINASTKKDRLKWQEAIIALFDKAMEKAVEAGIAKREILDGDLTINLPLVSLAALKLMMDVWFPVYQDGNVISTYTFRNMLPGVDPQKEDKLIADEKAERAKNSPLNNMKIPPAAGNGVPAGNEPPTDQYIGG